MRSHFRLDPTTRHGGRLSVDISGPTSHESGELQIIHNSLSRERHDTSCLLIIKTILKKRDQDHLVQRTRGTRVDRSST